MKLLLKPHLVFLLAALIFGVAMIIVTPPFRVPDEVNHFYRAYQISEGELIPTRSSKRLGGYLPLALHSFTGRFHELIAHPGQRISYDQIGELNIKVNPTQRQWYDFPNTAIYSFLNYAPQAVSIALIRSVTSSLLVIFYGSRLLSFLFWLGAAYWAIKLIPVKKWLFAALALLPMSLFINTSLSGDVVNNAISFFFMGWILHLSLKKQEVSTKDVTLLLFLSFAIAALKLVYTPLLLLVLLIPRRNFTSDRRRLVTLISAGAFAAAGLLLGYFIIDKLYLPYAEYAPEAGWVHLAEGADKNLQQEYLLQNLGELIPVIYRSLVHNFSMYSRGYIGTFGWLTIELPLMLIVAAYVFLILIASVKTSKIELQIRQKLIIATAFIGMLCLVVISQYLNWAIVGSELVNTLQGRYFIPVFPLLFLVLGKPLKMSATHIAALVTGGSSLLLVYSVVEIYGYYFL